MAIRALLFTSFTDAARLWVGFRDAQEGARQEHRTPNTERATLNIGLEMNRPGMGRIIWTLHWRREADRGRSRRFRSAGMSVRVRLIQRGRYICASRIPFVFLLPYTSLLV